MSIFLVLKMLKATTTTVRFHIVFDPRSIFKAMDYYIKQHSSYLLLVFKFPYVRKKQIIWDVYDQDMWKIHWIIRRSLLSICFRVHFGILLQYDAAAEKEVDSKIGIGTTDECAAAQANEPRNVLSTWVREVPFFCPYTKLQP